VGKGWFNMKETSKITYDFGKLKRFLTVVRLMMQDTLLALVRKNYYQYFDFVTSFIPQHVTVTNSHTVENLYDLSARKLVNEHHLFSIEMQRTGNDEYFLYSTVP